MAASFYFALLLLLFLPQSCDVRLSDISIHFLNLPPCPQTGWTTPTRWTAPKVPQRTCGATGVVRPAAVIVTWNYPTFLGQEVERSLLSVEPTRPWAVWPSHRWSSTPCPVRCRCPVLRLTGELRWRVSSMCCQQMYGYVSWTFCFMLHWHFVTCFINMSSMLYWRSVHVHQAAQCCCIWEFCRSLYARSCFWNVDTLGVAEELLYEKYFYNSIISVPVMQWCPFSIARCCIIDNVAVVKPFFSLSLI